MNDSDLADRNRGPISNEVVWKVLTSVAAENAERDRRMGQLTNAVDNLDGISQRLGQTLDRLEQRQERAAEERRDHETRLRLVEQRNGLTEAQKTALSQLVDAARVRGRLDWLTPDELDTVRAEIRNLPRVAREREALRADVDELCRWRTRHEPITDEVVKRQSTNETEIMFVRSTLEARTGVLEEYGRRLASVEQRPSPMSPAEHERVRQFLAWRDDWAGRVERSVEHFEQREEAAQSWEFWKRSTFWAQLVSLVVAMLLFVTGLLIKHWLGW